MSYIFKNYVWAFLSTELLDTQSEIVVDGSGRFPSNISPTEVLLCALDDGVQEPEIVSVVGLSGNTLSVLRGWEGSTARVWPIGTRIFNVVTAAMLTTLLPNAVDIAFPPSGTIEATNIEDAIQELDFETQAHFTSTDAAVAAISSALAGKQPLDAMLTALSALVTSNDKGLWFTGVDAPALFDLTTFGRSLVDDADAAAGRATLALGSIATLNTIGLSNIQTIGSNRILGNNTGGASVPLELTAAQVKALLAIISTDITDSTATGRSLLLASSALVAFDLIKQAASTSYQGAVTLQDQTGFDLGTDTAEAVTAALVWNSNIRNGWKNQVGANGSFEVWQRGAGGSASIAVAASSAAYFADRWYLATGANQASVCSQQPGLVDQSRYCARIQRNSGQTGTGVMFIGFPLDLDEVIKFRGKKVSVSMKVRAGANFSPTSGAIQCQLNFGTGGTIQKYSVGFTGLTQPLTPGLNANTSVQTLSGASAGAVATNVTQGELIILWTPTGTAGANDYLEIDDVDLRIDEPVPVTFERRPFMYEYMECLRHYQKSFNYNVAPAQAAGTNIGEFSWRSLVGASTATWGPLFYLPVPLRSAAPTCVGYNPSAANAEARNTTDSADCSATSIFGAAQNVVVATTTSGGTAVNEVLRVHFTLDASI